MRCVREASNVLHILACVLLTLVVTVSAATPSKASLTKLHLRSNPGLKLGNAFAVLPINSAIDKRWY
jgi:hypothetical protein